MLEVTHLMEGVALERLSFGLMRLSSFCLM